MDLNILIADDDQLVVERTVKNIRWKELGITHVFTAGNIRQAREILKQYPVRILLSDIEMPQGSGLELLEWIREEKLPVECIFLSSYAYFSYAQKAILLQSAEYLVKPVSNRELSQVLQRVVEKIAGEARGKEEDAAELWRSFFSASGQEQAEEHLRRQMSYRADDRFVMGGITICRSDGQCAEDDYDLQEERLCRIVSEAAEKAGIWPEYIGRGRQDSCFVVWNTNFLPQISPWENFFEQLSAAYQVKKGERIFLYLSDPCALSELQRKRALIHEMEKKYQPFEACVSGVYILYEGEFRRLGEENLMPPWDLWDRELLLDVGVDKLGECICRWLSSFAQRNCLTEDMRKGFLIELVQRVLDFSKRKRPGIHVFDEEEFRRSYISAEQSLPDMQEFIAGLFDGLERSRIGGQDSASAVASVCAYIEGHIGENLSRKKLARLVFLSEDYLSRQFFVKTGKSLPAYILEFRMKKAKEYLAVTDMPVGRVAMEVGFNNFSYFSKSFKDAVGMTPAEYRKRFMDSRE